MLIYVLSKAVLMIQQQNCVVLKSPYGLRSLKYSLSGSLQEKVPTSALDDGVNSCSEAPKGRTRSHSLIQSYVQANTECLQYAKNVLDRGRWIQQWKTNTIPGLMKLLAVVCMTSESGLYSPSWAHFALACPLHHCALATLPSFLLLQHTKPIFALVLPYAWHAFPFDLCYFLLLSIQVLFQTLLHQSGFPWPLYLKYIPWPWFIFSLSSPYWFTCLFFLCHHY